MIDGTFLHEGEGGNAEMARNNVVTEDQVRDEAREMLGLYDKTGVRAGVGQITTFNNLGFSGVSDKPDGLYLPDNRLEVAMILEAKAVGVDFDNPRCIKELQKNCEIVKRQYEKVIGILYNGDDVCAYKCGKEFLPISDISNDLQTYSYYAKRYVPDKIDKSEIFRLTKSINENLHFNFGMTHLQDRMIYTACALVAQREHDEDQGFANLPNEQHFGFKKLTAWVL